MSATQIRDFRAKFKLSQTELGSIVGRGRGTVAAWENGAVEPDLAASRLLASLDRSDPAVVMTLARSGAPGGGPADDAGGFAKFLRESKTGITVTDVAPHTPDGRWRRAEHVAKLDIDLVSLLTVARMDSVGSAPLVPEAPVRAPLSPLALDARLARLGVDYRPMETLEVPSVQPCWIAPPAVEWLSELDSVTGDAPALRSVELGFSTAGCRLAMTRTLLNLAGPTPADAVMAAAVNRALALATDTAALVGDGIKKPLGIANRDPLTADASGAFNADSWRAAIEQLELGGVGAQRVGVVAHPATKKKLSGIAFDGRNLWRDDGLSDRCGGRPAMVSTDLPLGSLLLGDFSTVTVRHRTKAHLVLRALGSTGGQELFAFLDVSVEVPQSGAFLLVSNV